MRENKFRAWDLDNKQMYFKGDDFGTTHDYEPLLYKKQGQNVVVMQYTGLKDKNGKDIFEGDIVEIEFEDGETSPMEVIYKAPRFFLCHEGFWSLGSKDVAYSVIGNIHETPELLEQQK